MNKQEISPLSPSDVKKFADVLPRKPIPQVPATKIEKFIVDHWLSDPAVDNYQRWIFKGAYFLGAAQVFELHASGAVHAAALHEASSLAMARADMRYA